MYSIYNIIIVPSMSLLRKGMEWERCLHNSHTCTGNHCPPVPHLYLTCTLITGELITITGIDWKATGNDYKVDYRYPTWCNREVIC